VPLCPVWLRLSCGPERGSQHREPGGRHTATRGTPRGGAASRRASARAVYDKTALIECPSSIQSACQDLARSRRALSCYLTMSTSNACWAWCHSTLLYGSGLAGRRVALVEHAPAGQGRVVAWDRCAEGRD